MKEKRQLGFTLLEVALAVVIGVMISIGVWSSYNVYNTHNKVDRGKLILNTLRNSIHFYNMNCSVGWPSLATLQSNDFGAGCIAAPNRPFYGDTNTRPFPADPFEKKNTVITPPIDGTGGWVYDAVTGDIFVNLVDDEVKYASKPSNW